MITLWSGFIILILILLLLDLGVFHRKDEVISAKEAILWTVFWVILSLIFNVVIYFAYTHHWMGIGEAAHHVQSGGDAALKYFTGYVIEKSLSLDNILVIAVIFSYFQVPLKYQHRVLFWGILGALIMRGVMIMAGTVLIQRFEWMIYIFGGFLLLTAVKMLVTKTETIEPDKNILIRIVKKVYPVSSGFDGRHFFTTRDNVRAVTPLFLVLLIIESTDVLFAVDSIPAIFAVTTDPFIVFTSNVFAILGLRSLYFALAAMLETFRYLKVSLVFVLAYVGVKMIFSHSFPIPTIVSLCIIGALLFVGIMSSIIVKKNVPAK